MTPEELNSVQAQTKFDSFVQKRLNAYKQQKEKIDTDYSKQQAAKMENDTLSLHKSWLEATDAKTKGKYNVASRANLLAEMVSNAAKDRWIEMTWSATDIVGSYLQWFPDAYQPFMDFTHSDQDPEEFAIQMGWMDAPEKNSNAFTNVLWGLTESALWIPKFLAKGTANLAWWSIKALWWDEERADAAVDKVKWAIDNFWFGDKDSTEYQVANVAWDIWQLLIPWVNAAKWVQLLSKVPAIAKTASKLPKLAKWLEKAEATAEKYPKIAKMLKRWEQWAEDMIKYNAINQQWTSMEDLTSWALLNIAFGGAWKIVSDFGWKALDRIWIGWLMNASKAKKVIEAIQTEWWGTKSVDDLAKWVNERPFQWSKEEIAAQARQWAKDAWELKNEVLSSVSKTFDSPRTTEWLKILEEWYAKSWNEKKLAEIRALIKNDNMYTPSEMEKARKAIQDSPSNPFRKEWIWEPKGTYKDVNMRDIYNDIKTQIERIWESEWLWNIKALNNEIVVANKLADWIASKTLSEEIKSWMATYWLGWAIVGYLAEWDIEWILKYGAGAIWLKLIKDTAVRTYLSRSIQKLKWTEKVELTKWINNWGEEALSESSNKALANILEKSDWKAREWIMSVIMDYAKEGARVWGVVWWAEIVDSITED